MKRFLAIFCIFFLGVSNLQASENMSKPISQNEIYKKWWLSKNNLSKIDIKLPDASTFDLAWTGETNLAVWLEKLPKIDRNKNKYLVLPSEGLVIPINDVSKKSKEYKNFISGKEESFLNLLDAWTVELPLTSANWYGSHGNKVIFWHSSYFKSNKWRYKTHFQKIIWMEKNEEVWVFEKNKNGFFDKYVYKVTKSYNTDDEDISILKQGKISELTLFTCTPIWWFDGRWVVKAKFLKKE